MKVLNLYAGIGGNRKLWTDVEVTAVELNPQIAKIYQDFFPNDKVIVVDAHQYLLEHFKEFEFIWSSPPCPTHSRINKANCISPYKDNSAQLAHGGGIEIRYPIMDLYQEIILLRHFYKGKYCVENVISYYEPLIKPTEIQRHYFWSNFHIARFKFPSDDISSGGDKERQERLGMNIDNYKIDIRKDKILRNCVLPELGLHILNESKREVYQELFK
jgi:DNA (cytosine-5)-methyltransferase 1